MSDLNKYISNRLKVIRQSSGMTQSEVAKLSGTNTNYYAKVERGEAMPSVKILGRIVKALKVKSTDILPF